MIEHNIRIAQLNTRLAELHSLLNFLQKNDSRNEELYINQIDYERLIVILSSSSFHIIIYFE
jgi:hypothetical protein